MALDSDVVAEKEVAKCEIASTEDMVQALIEKLVDPRLPLRKAVSSGSPPTKEQHDSVATQMHAVVVLYNYYHRKQKPELEFVDFVSFCTLAVTLRPTMVAFMKWTNECTSTELNGAEDQLSVTEKAIKDACDIAAGLDASLDVPDKGGWPLSKVAVLFVDSKRENCMLRFGAVTEGVWSLFEKELDKPRINPEISSGQNSGEKRKRSAFKSLAADSELLQIGYDLVKEITGIEDYKLKVLGSHIAYSLTKEKAATQFYILQGPVKVSIYEEIPLKYLAESLQGPFAAKSFGSWSATDIVNYYHMLPYTGFISHWLSRKDLWPPVHGDYAQSIINVCSQDIFCKKSTSPVLIVPKQDPDGIDNNRVGTSVTENNGERYKKRVHSSRVGISRSAVKIKTIGIDEHAADKVNEKHKEPSSAKRKSGSDVEHFIDGLSKRGNDQTMDLDKHATDEFNKKHVEPCSAKSKSGSEVEHFIDGLSTCENDQTMDLDKHSTDEFNQKHVEPFSAKITASSNVENLINGLSECENVQAIDIDKHTAEEFNQKLDESCSAKRKSSSKTENFINGMSDRANAQTIDVVVDKHASNEVNKKHNKPFSGKMKSNSYLENFINGLNERGNVSQSGPGLSQKIHRDDTVSTKVNTPHATLDSSKHESTRNNVENLEAPNVDVPKTLQSGPSQKTSLTNNDTLKFNKGRNIMGSVIKEEGKIGPETPDKIREAGHSASIIGPPEGLESVCDLRGTALNGGTREKLNSQPTILYYRRQKKVSSPVVDTNGSPDDGANLNTKLLDSLKRSHVDQCNDGRVSGKSGEVSVSSDQSQTAKPVENQLCQLESDIKPIVALQNVPASDVLQNALVLLYNKRQQLFSEICTRGDMLAQYEYFIERIRDHGEICFARACTESIISGNNGWVLNLGEKQTRSSGKIYIPGTSKCQDLEDMCVRNNWRLPRYNVESSEGKFSSNVSLVSKDLQLTSKGCLESSPTKARESAAAQMIADICEHM